MSALQRVAPQEASGDPQGGGDERAPRNPGDLTSPNAHCPSPASSLQTLAPSHPNPGSFKNRELTAPLPPGVQADVRDALLYPLVCQQDVPARHVRVVRGVVEGGREFGGGGNFLEWKGLWPPERVRRQRG